MTYMENSFVTQLMHPLVYISQLNISKMWNFVHIYFYRVIRLIAILRQIDPFWMTFLTKTGYRLCIFQLIVICDSALDKGLWCMLKWFCDNLTITVTLVLPWLPLYELKSSSLTGCNKNKPIWKSIKIPTVYHIGTIQERIQEVAHLGGTWEGPVSH